MSAGAFLFLLWHNWLIWIFNSAVWAWQLFVEKRIVTDLLHDSIFIVKHVSKHVCSSFGHVDIRLVQIKQRSSNVSRHLLHYQCQNKELLFSTCSKNNFEFTLLSSVDWFYTLSLNVPFERNPLLTCMTLIPKSRKAPEGRSFQVTLCSWYLSR